MGTKARSEYDIQAEEFLKKHGVQVTVIPHETQCPPPFMSEAEIQENRRRSAREIERKYLDSYRPAPKPIGHGVRYVVTISNVDGNGRAVKGRRPLSFDFWGSIKDAQDRKTPTAYDVLACVSSDSYCPRAFSEFCAEYGYDEDSRKAYATFEACNEFAAKIQAFFTGEQLTDLEEIH